MRNINLFQYLAAFVTIVLAIAVTGALGIGLTNGMIAVGIVMFPALARIVRRSNVRFTCPLPAPLPARRR